LPPRAIVHATCGPVHASVTTPVASSTFPFATSPAFVSKTPISQQPAAAPKPHFAESATYVASVERRPGG
jgi:hypothetical protein